MEGDPEAKGPVDETLPYKVPPMSVCRAVIEAIRATPEELAADEELMRRVVREVNEKKALENGEISGS